MMKLLKTKIILLVAFAPLVVLAQSDSLGGLETAIEGTNLVRRNIPEIVATIINAILGLLGVLFTFLIIWGGIRWMTSQGNSQQVEDAKKILQNAFIGLAIVLASYGIVKFAFEAFEAPTEGAVVETGGQQ